MLNNDAEVEEIREEGAEPSYRIVGDPTEGALLVAAAKAGAYIVEVKQSYPRENEIPFDSERKRMITIHDVKNPQPTDASPFHDEKQRNWDVIVVKGAPDVVLQLCTRYQDCSDHPQPLTAEKRAEILAANDAMSSDALRVLGLAFRLERDVPDSLEGIAPESLEK